MENTETESYATLSGSVQIEYWDQKPADPLSTDFFKNGTIEIRNLNNDLVATDLTDGSGSYSVSGLSLGFHTIEASLEGPFAKINNSVLHVFPIIGGGTHNWTWDASDATNVYYHMNKIHDFITSTPFNYSAMNIKMDAVLTNDNQLSAKARNGPNHNFSEIIFGTFNSKQWARSSDVVYHEYTHGIIWRLYGGNDIGGSVGEGGAMDEGLSDYFAATINDDEFFGESLLSPERDLTNTWIFDENLSIHRNGQVIGGACWDLRQTQGIGSAIADQLVFEALQMTPHAFNFDDFALNMLIADDNDGNLSNSVPHFSEIETAFETNHDITVHIPVIVSISGPTTREVDEEGTWTATAAGGVTPYSYAWKYAVGPEYDTFQSVGSNSSSLVFSNDVTFLLQITVTDDENFTGIDVHNVLVSGTGRSKISTVRLPMEFGLDQNYPNPFNPTTTISYQLPEASRVTLTVFNTAGQEVALLIDGQVSAGFHTIQWNASGMASGVYFYRIKAGRFTDMKRMVVLKQ